MTLPGGETKELVWKRTDIMSVDGTKASKLAERYKLVDKVGPENVIAVFTGKKGVSTQGPAAAQCRLGPRV